LIVKVDAQYLTLAKEKAREIASNNSKSWVSFFLISENDKAGRVPTSISDGKAEAAKGKRQMLKLRSSGQTSGLLNMRGDRHACSLG
jgi:hypothetical protein